MQNDEVADRFNVESCLTIELVDIGLFDGGQRKHLRQSNHVALDEMNARRLQRLDKATRKTDCDDILAPVREPHARPELDQPRIGDEFTFHVVE